MSLTNITEFYWSQNVSIPSFALEVWVDLGSSNECEIFSGAGSGPGGPGPNSISIREMDYGAGWGAGSSGSGYASAHAGPVDTRSLETSGGGGATLSGSRGTFEGTMRLTLLARDVAPADASFFTSPASLVLSIECDRPFDLRDASASSEATLVNTYNLSGGAGAEVFVAGSANLQDSVTSTVSSSRVRIAAAGFGAHGGRVQAQGPDVSEEWVFFPTFPVGVTETFFAADGAPGDYTLTVDHGGAYFEAFWVAVWGLEPGYDLSLGQQAEPTVDSPF